MLAPIVQSALARKLITFEAQTAPVEPEPGIELPEGETGYPYQCYVTATGNSNPYACQASCTYAANASCASTGCKQWQISAGLYGQYVSCSGPQLLINRKCTFANDPNNPCGVAGPGGCAVCSTIDLEIPESGCSGCSLFVNTSGYCAYRCVTAL